jgi:hypothetical protein
MYGTFFELWGSVKLRIATSVKDDVLTFPGPPI